MTQKNKVKELVGQSLNAYNTRVNNQMNRITSENKRQNHMINVLNTELVKDYLTKTEEASVRYSGETPIASKLKKTDSYVGMNTYDINENILPYLMDMDYRVILLQIQSGQTVAKYKSLGNIFLMLQRDIKSKRYSKDEYIRRIEDYYLVGSLSDSEYEMLGGLLND